MIPFEDLAKSNQIFFDDYRREFDKSLARGKFILSDNVIEFENNYAAFCESKYFTSMGNGTDAITIALKSFDFKENSEIIVAANTFIASILAIINAGLKPVLVEPNVENYTIDIQKIESKINSKTVAIIAVHLYGKCCDMDSMNDLSKKYNLKIIEDCAQAHGARYKNKIAGSFGHIGAHSFYPTKILGALGDAGGCTSNDSELAAKLNSMRNYGSSIKYHNEILGLNSRMDELQAGFLLVKLKRIDEILCHKQKLAHLYFKNLKSDYIVPVLDPDYKDVYYIFNIRHPKRDKLKKFLLKNGIGTEIHYPIAPHQQKSMKFLFEKDTFPITELLHATNLSLPISMCHMNDDVEKVVELLNKF